MWFQEFDIYYIIKDFFQINSKQIAHYIQFLENHKLVESRVDWPYKRRIIYKTTEAGKKYIEAYKKLENVFK